MSRSLYHTSFEHDACGVGFVAQISGRPSHRILQMALEAVKNMAHRGAVDADAKTGDGAGVLTQLPLKLFQREFNIPDASHLAVGMLFLPVGAEPRQRCRTIVEGVIARHGIHLLAWRPVPVNPSVLGDKARGSMPSIEQVLLLRPPHIPQGDFETHLYRLRREMEIRIAEEGIEGFYIPSLSHRTIVYKGLMASPQLRGFYPDLLNPDFETPLAVFHQRYSTNTLPNWFLAQPFRWLAHNGEINTIQGNRNWMRAREKDVITPGGSDSASLDNVLEFLVHSGKDIWHAVMMLIPEAWENMPEIDPQLRAFYEYHACLMEPWDGPAAVAFTDGIVVGATLDRNGLRPARYILTDDGVVILASEVGVLPIDDSRVVRKGRLGPGQKIAVDTNRGLLLLDEPLKREVVSRHPYRQWVDNNILRFEGHPAQATPSLSWEELRPLMTSFGYTEEELEVVLRPMVVEGKEPVGSMGDDAPLAVLSKRPRLLYDYFKQRFAQVTNPPIDHIRERLVMSLDVYLGARRGMEQTRLLHLKSPILLDEELKALKEMKDPAFSSITLQTCFEPRQGRGLEGAIEELCHAVTLALGQGKSIIILSDRPPVPSLAPIPMLLAVGAVHHHLIREGKRMQASIVAETGEARQVHHMALLLGYGASAINPYLALSIIPQLVGDGNLDPAKARANYKRSLEEGILKVMSKMGISTLSGYMGAQIFEAIGLSEELVELAFEETPSRIGGISLKEIERDCLLRWERERLEYGGEFRFRTGGEAHAFSPQVVKALHKAVRSGAWEDYRFYSEMINRRTPLALRDLLTFKPRDPIPLKEVEPVENIMRRFSTAGMSLGALSPETHRVLAQAMNRIGAESNSGEGGEDPSHFRSDANNKVKQVASARFGVTTEYLINASELQIKIAQGSKPGEGGQLPGHKVSSYIASIRHAQPGISLISPPPHHDIYSIEDLSQLIYDLKKVNPRARVSVKLVAEAGVGTIAAGVAKAYADVILISGHDGGTGASPLSSIKNAGSPWELGLAETQQVLVMNDLRGRVALRVDGGLKNGRDVVIAALLGAEEFSFGSAALVAAGCVMTRRCHLNTCPVGVATQDETLRAKFTGTPEMVINFFTFIAQEVREILARLGFRGLDEIIGRTDLLQQVPAGDPKADSLDLSPILAQMPGRGVRRRMMARNDPPHMDDAIASDVLRALEGGGPVRLSYTIKNHQRAVGARLAGELALRYGGDGLPHGTIELHFKGSAGQSFGAFCVNGMRLILEGEANDYVGKGMSGGEIVVRPPSQAPFSSYENVIMGNTVLYGATAGCLYAAGRAGERFAVRNSGATAVVEGIGDHGCEYMTGGTVVILGDTGRNFAAGMTGGMAFVLDKDGEFEKRYNPELVGLERVLEDEEAEGLRDLIEEHLRWTGSRRAKEILDRWDHYLPLFWKVVPHPSEVKIESARLSEQPALQSSPKVM